MSTRAPPAMAPPQWYFSSVRADSGLPLDFRAPSPVPWDAKAHFQAQFQFLANAIHSGQSPFWTPNVFAGSPQIADPQSLIFSPVISARACSSPSRAFGLGGCRRVRHARCGGLALIMSFRDRGWHVGGALVAALAFAFGGSAAWRIQHIGQIESFAFSDDAVAADARARPRSLRYGVGAGVAAGLIVVGRDQVALLGAYLWLSSALAVVRVGPTSAHALRASAGLLAGVAARRAIVASAAAVTLRPGVRAQTGRRSIYDGRGQRLAASGSSADAGFADLFGAPDPRSTTGGRRPARLRHPRHLSRANMGQLYLGALPSRLCLRGLVARLLGRATSRFFRGAALLLVYALGRYTPAFALMYRYLPGVDLFRRPADATFLLVRCWRFSPATLASSSLAARKSAPRAASPAPSSRCSRSRLLSRVFKRSSARSRAKPLALSAGFAALAFAVIALAPRLGRARAARRCFSHSARA